MVCPPVRLPARVLSLYTSSRQKRLQEQLNDMTLSDSKHGSVIRVSDFIHSHPMGNNEHIVQEIHDILLSYYKLARKRFVDNMRMQVADYFLVTGPDTALKLFSPAFVTAVTSEQLETVAGEDPTVRRQRTGLEKGIELLQKARGILQ